MKKEIYRNALALNAGLIFAFTSLMLMVSGGKSRYWLSKKAKYAALLMSLTETEPQPVHPKPNSFINSPQRYAETRINALQSHSEQKIKDKK